jgi:hypothetical protein
MSTEKADRAEEEQKEDEQALARNARDVEEIMQLLDAGVDRAEADRRLQEARGLVEQHRKGLVFHDHKGSRVAVHHHASNLHKLAEALELSWKTKRHGADLHKALHAHLRHRIRVLERVHARGFGFV